MDENFRRSEQQVETARDREPREREADDSRQQSRRATEHPHLTRREREERWPIG
jgi:hypothetical protein